MLTFVTFVLSYIVLCCTYQDTLAPNVRVQTERRLKSLEGDLARAELASKERTMAVKYHRVKFFGASLSFDRTPSRCLTLFVCEFLVRPSKTNPQDSANQKTTVRSLAHLQKRTQEPRGDSILVTRRPKLCPRTSLPIQQLQSLTWATFADIQIVNGIALPKTRKIHLALPTRGSILLRPIFVVDHSSTNSASGRSLKRERNGQEEGGVERGDSANDAWGGVMGLV